MCAARSRRGSQISEEAGSLLGRVRINAGQKARVFLSSRMGYVFEGAPLSKLREELKRTLESVYPFLSVELAEQWTAGRSGSARDLSRKGGADADIVVVILVDSAGYRDEAGLYATELEINAAIEDSWDKMLVFAHEDLQRNLERQPASYRKLFRRLSDFENGRIVSFFSTRDELLLGIVNGVSALAGSALRRFSSRISGKSEEQADWELMTFTERFAQLKATFREVAEGLDGIGTIHGLGFESEHDGHSLYVATTGKSAKRKLPVVVSACPDRYSFPEAARFVGYPFRTAVDAWEKLVKRWKQKTGPLHIVLIYRTITDTQIRRHLGNPDIRVAREPWGYFARDPERFIQTLYLVDCRDPVSLRERVHDALGWIAGGQLEKLLDRAEGRGRILEARRLSGD